MDNVKNDLFYLEKLAQILEETEPDILRNAARLPG